MGFLRSLFASKAEPPVDQIVLAGQQLAKNYSNTLLADLKSAHRQGSTMPDVELSERLWALETAVWAFVAVSLQLPEEFQQRFFAGFLGVAHERMSVLPDGRQRPPVGFEANYSAAIELLRTAHNTADHSQAARDVGKLIALYLGLPDGDKLASAWVPVGIRYNEQIVSAANALKDFAALDVRDHPGAT